MGARSVTSTPPNGIWPAAATPPAEPGASANPTVGTAPPPPGDGLENAVPVAAATPGRPAPATTVVGGLSVGVAAEGRVGTRDFASDASPALTARLADLLTGLETSI